MAAVTADLLCCTHLRKREERDSVLHIPTTTWRSLRRRGRPGMRRRGEDASWYGRTTLPGRRSRRQQVQPASRILRPGGDAEGCAGGSLSLSCPAEVVPENQVVKISEIK